MLTSMNLIPQRVANAGSAQLQQARGMATLKEISMRLKSTQNIQKITSSMKMVSAAKFSRAEKALNKSGRGLGIAINRIYEATGLAQPEAPEKKCAIAISSDRGLCGGIHSAIAKGIKAELAANKNTQYKFVFVGDKTRLILQKMVGKDILVHFSEVGRKPATFIESSAIAQKIIETGEKFDVTDVWYNKFKSAISYDTTKQPVFSAEALGNAPELTPYEIEDDILDSYAQFTLANTIMYCQIEGAASEQSARMQAMENATKNAEEMIGSLQLLYNRTRQAVITRELIEIISGAAALD
eukprot:Nk52_evm37s2506 gene=Nk52_evmTU37s2506